MPSIGYHCDWVSTGWFFFSTTTSAKGRINMVECYLYKENQEKDWLTLTSFQWAKLFTHNKESGIGRIYFSHFISLTFLNNIFSHENVNFINTKSKCFIISVFTWIVNSRQSYTCWVSINTLKHSSSNPCLLSN